MARSRRKKTTKDRLIDAALYAAPAPVRTIASNPYGFRLMLIGGAILMATGILTLDWSGGTPQFKFHRDKARQVREELTNDIGSRVQGWSAPSSQGNENPPGIFTQTPYDPYQQFGQQPIPQPQASGVQTYQGNPGLWGQNQRQGNGYYYPSAPQPNPYPPAYGAQPYSNPQVPNSSTPQWPNQQWPNQQWPNQQWPNQQLPAGYRR